MNRRTTIATTATAPFIPVPTLAVPIDHHAEYRRNYEEALTRANDVARTGDDETGDAIYFGQAAPWRDRLLSTPPQTLQGAAEQIRWCVDNLRDGETINGDEIGALKLVLARLEALS